jgi:small subunit ribosomal protein S16
MVLLKITGDWQKFKGLPGAEGTLRVKEAKVTKNDIFAQTVASVANEPRVPTIRPKVEKPVEGIVAAPEEVAVVASDEVVVEAPVVSTESEASPEVLETPAEVVEETPAEVTEEA